MDLALRREGDTLRVRADVHAPAGAGLGKPARLELHLDARPSAERRADCSDGVERFVFALDRCAVQTRTGAACRLGLRRTGRPRGARLEFGLPLRRIAPGGAAPGARLAADVLLAVAGPDGREAGRLTLGGARSPHPNPLAWPPLLLG
jgi:hypothetical protein